LFHGPAGGEDAHGSPQGRGRGGRPVGDHHCEAVQYQIDRMRRILRRGQGAGGAADLCHIAGPCQPPGEKRRHPGGQVGLTGQAEVERLEPLGRLEQQRRCCRRARGQPLM